jgi:dihydrofolate reductase
MATILHFTCSLDGFIEDGNGGVDWGFEYRADVLPEADRVMRGAGAVISGRRGYDVAAASGPVPRPYGGAWHGAILVLSHRPAPADAPADFRFVNAPVGEAIELARAAAAEVGTAGDVLIFSADIARQALDAGLVDEVLLHIVPTVLGSGVRLFEGVRERIRLETVLTAQSGQVTTLLLRPVAPVAA